MPKVKSYSAPFLSQGPGRHLFAAHNAAATTPTTPSLWSSKKIPVSGPRRTIARRGTEVFVAVGKEIRWQDLVYLKENWASEQLKTSSRVRIKREDSVEPNNIGVNSINDDFKGIRVSVRIQSIMIDLPWPMNANTVCHRD
jgi:nucleoporin NUP82